MHATIVGNLCHTVKKKVKALNKRSLMKHKRIQSKRHCDNVSFRDSFQTKVTQFKLLLTGIKFQLSVKNLSLLLQKSLSSCGRMPLNNTPYILKVVRSFMVCFIYNIYIHLCVLCVKFILKVSSLVLIFFLPHKRILYKVSYCLCYLPLL